MISACRHILRPSLRHALHQLRQPSRLKQLSGTQDPSRFIDEMFLASGRNLAVAASFLSSENRQEGKIAFLCCRALDAHEDLHSDRHNAADGIRGVAEYLQGNSEVSAPPPWIEDVRESDRLEWLIAARLPWLRQAILALPEFRKARVLALIEDLAQAMEFYSAATSRAGYGERVLGRVVRYCLDLMQVEVAATVDPTSIGRLCQAANDLRDLAHDTPESSVGEAYDRDAHATLLWLELAESTTVLTSVLRDLKFPKAAGACGATVYLMATTLKFIARKAKYPQPWLTAHPLLGAVLADLSMSAYRRVLLQVDRTILGILFHLSERRGEVELSSGTSVPLIRATYQDAFESELADQHPDPQSAVLLKRGCRLMRFALLLTINLPRVAISQRPPNNSDGQLLMMSDYLMAAALTVMQRAGLSVLGGFCRTFSKLSEDLQQSPEPTDRNGHVAEFLTQVVENARGTSATQLAPICARNRDISRNLHCRDRRKFG